MTKTLNGKDYFSFLTHALDLIFQSMTGSWIKKKDIFFVNKDNEHVSHIKYL